MALTEESANAILGLSRYGEAYWKAIGWDALLLALSVAYKHIKAELQGRHRHEMRLAMGERVRWIEEKVQRGQTGVAIRHILGPNKLGFAMETLKIDGRFTSNQEIINERGKLYFKSGLRHPGTPCRGALENWGPVADWRRWTSRAG